MKYDRLGEVVPEIGMAGYGYIDGRIVAVRGSKGHYVVDIDGKWGLVRDIPSEIVGWNEEDC